MGKGCETGLHASSDWPKFSFALQARVVVAILISHPSEYKDYSHAPQNRGKKAHTKGGS